MTVVSARVLARETSRVLDDLYSTPHGTLVTRDGAPCAIVLPLTPVEQVLYARLLAEGIDPLAPAEPPPADMSPLPPVTSGKSASDYLREERDSYYTGS